MPTGNEVLNTLVKADDALTSAYSKAPPGLRSKMDMCALAIEGVIKQIVRDRLHQRTTEIGKLSKELNGATDELKTIKSTIDDIKNGAALADGVIKTLTAVLPLI